MSIQTRQRLTVPAAVLATLVGIATTARAQMNQDLPSEFESWRLPGWSFTPGATFGLMYDSNVVLAAPDLNKKTPSDKLLAIEPSGQLEFFSPRTEFSSG